jgi:hypothetical protein
MSSTPAPRSAGCLLALAVIGGAVIGALTGEPSLGIVIGLGVGAAATVLLWLIDRRRG